MKERTKETLRDGFGCLVNNSAALRGAKNGPLWLTIVMFFLSILLPVLPLFISAANTTGSAFISSKSYGLERYVTRVAIDLKGDEYTFNLNEKHEMEIKRSGSTITYSDYVSQSPLDENKVADATPLASYIDTVTGQYDLRLYVSNQSGSSKFAKNLNEFVANKAYKAETIEEKNAETDPDNTLYYHSSYIIVFKDTIYVVVYYGDKAVAGSMGGNFTSLKTDKEYLTALLDVKDKEGNVVVPSLANSEYCDGVLKNFKKFLNKTYDSIKWRNTFATSGIYLAIFAGLSLFMGLLMWVMTRGKNNPNNYFSIWLCLKVEARLGLAPGLITFILGLFLTQYASMIFILTMGLRVMWISMKELRPVQQ